MTGQIPKYGTHFRLEHPGSHPVLASRVYVLKRDARWFIRSDKTSGRWIIYRSADRGADRDAAIAISPPVPTLGIAMTRLLYGIDGGYYRAAEPGTDI